MSLSNFKLFKKLKILVTKSVIKKCFAKIFRGFQNNSQTLFKK